MHESERPDGLHVYVLVWPSIEPNHTVQVQGAGSGPAGVGILDAFQVKDSALRLAVDAALTVLRVDQIIMAKPAGGPKPRDGGPEED